MLINDLRTYVANRINSLTTELTTATIQGNVPEIDRIEQELADARNTLEKL